MKLSPRCFTDLQSSSSSSPSPSPRSLLSLVSLRLACGACWSQALHLISLLQFRPRDQRWMFGGNLTLSADQQPFACNCSSCRVCALSPTMTTNSCSQGVCVSPPPLLPSLSLSLLPASPPPTPSQVDLFTAACLPLPLTLCPVSVSHPFTASPSLSLALALSLSLSLSLGCLRPAVPGPLFCL